ncbi:MAG: LytTR family DNA-binding domain-containing protein [Bacteroidota bacterium]
MKILLLEDDQRFIDLFSILLSQIGEYATTVTRNMHQCLSTFVQHTDEIDLCILDIDLGRGQENGIATAQRIRAMDSEVPIIFLTSMYNEHYYSSCKEVNPTAFLHKNLDALQLKQAMELRHQTSEPMTVKKYDRPSMSSERLFVKIGDKYKAISTKEISYFSADRKTVYCHIDERKYPIRTSLKSIATKLDDNFIRVHRSYIVNINMIKMVNFVEDTININNAHVPIGAIYKKGLLDKAIWLK